MLNFVFITCQLTSISPLALHIYKNVILFGLHFEQYMSLTLIIQNMSVLPSLNPIHFRVQ